jgi:hypothetical protein
METNILRRIFFDEQEHWEEFKSKHGKKIRSIVVKEVEKFRDCGNLKKGLSYWYVKDAMILKWYRIDVKEGFARHVHVAKQRNGVECWRKKYSK